MDKSKFRSGNVPKKMSVAAVSPDLGTSHPAWSDYIQRAAAGEQQALASLYDESSHIVYSLALRILGNAADAEEVTLDVYTQVWRSAGKFDSQRAAAATWLVMLARSRAIDRLRSCAARRTSEEPLPPWAEFADTAERPDEAGAASQQRRFIRAALESLSRDQREAIELAYFSGFSHSEIAARLGQPLGTVKTRIRLGMIRLRELLEPLGEGSV
ncbi:MAG: sigma-70 family RNA polymerase sigma factor [Acidobacteriota bacterium]